MLFHKHLGILNHNQKRNFSNQENSKKRMTNLSKYLIENVVKNEFCIGCGVCSGACPHDLFNMEMNESGIFQPSMKTECKLVNCNLCVTSCPFWNQDSNETVLSNEIFGSKEDAKFDQYIGNYEHLYSGFVTNNRFRESRSSGGLATWLLVKLINLEEIDHVICVTSTPNQDTFFKFSALDNTDEVLKASRSCYYPVEISQMIKFISKNPGKYAITGIPCYIKAIRLLMKRNKIIAQRVKFLFGLVCGQSQNKYFVDYLYSMVGGNKSDLSEVIFRTKNPKRPASDYGVKFVSSKNYSDVEVLWNEGMGAVWKEGYFRPEACNYCDDIFAELADITFMDAWLPQFSHDNAGTNLVITRNQRLEEVLNRGQKEDAIALSEITTVDIHKSQQGVIYRKRDELAYRLFLLRKRKKYYPHKRVIPNNNKSLSQSISYRIDEFVRLSGKNVFHKANTNTYTQLQKKTWVTRHIRSMYRRVYKRIKG